MLVALAAFHRAQAKGRLTPGVEFSMPLPDASLWLYEHHKAETAGDAEAAIQGHLSDRTAHQISRGVTVRIVTAGAGIDCPTLYFQFGKRPLMPAEPAAN